jgi:hypothetical protein
LEVDAGATLVDDWPLDLGEVPDGKPIEAGNLITELIGARSRYSLSEACGAQDAKQAESRSKSRSTHHCDHLSLVTHDVSLRV